MSIFNKDGKEDSKKNIFDVEPESNEEEMEFEEAPAPVIKPETKDLKLDLDIQESQLNEKPFVDEMGVVAKGTTIHGSIKTKGHLAIAGSVEGDVSCAGNLMLTGDVKGSVECYNIVLGSNLKLPKLVVKENVSIKENTEFTGDITCNNISIMGIVKGNITANGNIGISKTAVIEGNITAKVLAIEPGAKVKGFVNIA